MWVPSSNMRGGDEQEEDNSSSTSLDLNNFPNDDHQFSTDAHGTQQLLLDHHHHHSSSSSSSGGQRRKKSGGKVVDDKVYECRFCSLKFCKSQALGGHMNRHRQERETETLNRARQLVFSSDNLAVAATAQGHLGYPTNMIDPTALHQFSPTTTTTATVLYPPPRMFSAAATASPPPLTRLYNPISDYCVGHVLHGATTTTAPPNLTFIGDSSSSGGSYTCIGAPVGQGFQPAGPSTRFGHHHH